MSTITGRIENLQVAINSFLALISHYQYSLSRLSSPPSSNTSPTAPTPRSQTSSITPLFLLYDTASLTKAHATKLSLLLTSSSLSATAQAATTVISTIQTSVLPPLLTALELFHAQNHGKIIICAATQPVEEVFRGFRDIVGGPLKTIVDDALKKGATGKEKVTTVQKDAVVLPSIGKIWGACDRLIAIKGKGLFGIVADRLRGAEETIRDATTELDRYYKKHSPQDAIVSSDKSSSGEEGDNDNSDGDGDYEDDEDIFWDEEFSPSSPSTGNPPTRKKRKPFPPHMIASIITSLKRFKTVTLLLKTIHNHRLTPPRTSLPDPAYTTSPNVVTISKLEAMVDFAEGIVIYVDELVGEYYELGSCTTGEDGPEMQKVNRSS